MRVYYVVHVGLLFNSPRSHTCWLVYCCGRRAMFVSDSSYWFGYLFHDCRSRQPNLPMIFWGGEVMARSGGGGIFAWLFFKDVSIISLSGFLNQTTSVSCIVRRSCFPILIVQEGKRVSFMFLSCLCSAYRIIRHCWGFAKVSCKPIFI